MNNGSSTNGILIGILVLVVIVIVGWLAYSQGFFEAKEENSGGSLQINLGGDSNK